MICIPLDRVTQMSAVEKFKLDNEPIAHVWDQEYKYVMSGAITHISEDGNTLTIGDFDAATVDWGMFTFDQKAQDTFAWVGHGTLETKAESRDIEGKRFYVLFGDVFAALVRVGTFYREYHKRKMGLPPGLPLPEEAPGTDIPVFRDAKQPAAPRKILVWRADKTFRGELELTEVDHERYAIAVGKARFYYVGPIGPKLSTISALTTPSKLPRRQGGSRKFTKVMGSKFQSSRSLRLQLQRVMAASRLRRKLTYSLAR